MEQNVVSTQNDSAFDYILQLPDIAWPGMVCQHAHRLRREASGNGTMLPGKTPQEFFCQTGDIFPALAQRRHRDRNHIEPKEKILTEFLFLHALLQVAIGGRNDPNIHFYRSVPADPLQLPFLKHAKQLGLNVWRDFTDFIQ